MKVKHGSQPTPIMERNTEPKAKKRKVGDTYDMLGDDFNAADIEIVPELEKGNIDPEKDKMKAESEDMWDEELTEKDNQNIDDLFNELERNVEPEKRERES